MEITRHFTVTTTIVHKNKVLLHFHKKLKKWLPIGGHIDRDELPDEAAIREAREEAGIKIKLHSAYAVSGHDGARDLKGPARLMLQDINGHHQHIDFSYYATSDSFKLKPYSGETKMLRWFTVGEIKNIKAPENVKVRALEALKILGKGK
jgi:ADP-ribose pyrophosphatase YjhB (NUDIX family)